MDPDHTASSGEVLSASILFTKETFQGFSYLFEVGARGLLSLGKSICIIKIGKT